MFLIINKDGYRMCQDGKWRDFANFGTYQENVKEYRSLGWAKRAIRGRNAAVVKVPEGMSVDASGKVLEEVPTTPGYHRVVHHKLSEYIVARDPLFGQDILKGAGPLAEAGLGWLLES